jgi:hypothetical protein
MTYRENKRRACKAIFFFHQCIDNAFFEKIVALKTTKEAWTNLVKAFFGDDNIKRVKFAYTSSLELL